MIKALWFMLKLAGVIALAVWVADRPGSVRLEWMDYVVHVHMGLFLLVMLGVILLAIFVYQIIRAFVTFPASYRQYSGMHKKEKGYKALTLGLASVAAGDRKMAVYHAYRARQLLPDDKGLPLLLEAQAARLDGREDDAAKAFAGLLENPDAGFLGVRGLLQTALDEDDYDTAQHLCDRAADMYPKQPWILETAYDVAVHAGQWDKARALLKRREKAGSIDAADVKKERASLYLVEAYEYLGKGWDAAALENSKKASRAEKDFVPAVLMQVEAMLRLGEIRAARKTLETAWKRSPHESYVAIWKRLLKTAKGGPDGDSVQPLEMLKHMGQLVKLNGSVALAHREAGRSALEAGLWGEARDYFLRSEKIEPSAELYRLLAALEERSGEDHSAERAWFEKAVGAPVERGWVDMRHDRLYEQWQPLSTDGRLNFLEWARLPSETDLPLLQEQR